MLVLSSRAGLESVHAPAVRPPLLSSASSGDLPKLRLLTTKLLYVACCSVVDPPATRTAVTALFRWPIKDLFTPDAVRCVVLRAVNVLAASPLDLSSSARPFYHTEQATDLSQHLLVLQSDTRHHTLQPAAVCRPPQISGSWYMHSWQRH